jgi:hypothetical protein
MSFPDIASPEVLPEGFIRLGPLVAWQRDAHYWAHSICVWHWCDKSGWRAKGAREGWTPVEDAMYPEWLPSGCEAHTLVSTEPLHLEPSIYWPDCCGLHGFIRDGAWVGV